MESDKSQKAWVRMAAARLKRGSTMAGPALAVMRSGTSPTSSGRRTRNSQTGRKPTASAVMPIATQP